MNSKRIICSSTTDARLVFKTTAAFIATAFLAITLDTQAQTDKLSADLTVYKAAGADGPRRLRASAADGVSLYRKPSLQSARIDFLASGEAVSNFGCTKTKDQIWCLIQPLKGGVKLFAPGENLRPTTDDNGMIVTGIDDSPQRAIKGDFDAQATIACAQEHGQDLGDCNAGVARSSGGDASVVVTFNNGFSRILYFKQNAFIRANATMSGVGTDTAWRAEDNLHVIRVDDQQFVLPDNFIFKK